MRRLIICLLSVCLFSPALADTPVSIEPIPTRLFGYQLGDVVNDSVDIRLKEGLTLDTSTLPKLGKRAGAFMVRNVTVTPTAGKPGETRFTLSFEMQLINTPQTVRTLTIPPIQLRFLGTTPIQDTVPSLTVDVAPLDTGEIRSGLPEVAGLRSAPFINVAPFIQHLEVLGLVAAILLAWLGLTLVMAWRNRRVARPFRDTRRRIKRAIARMDNLEATRAVLKEIHRAFDTSLGHRLFTPEVEAFCKQEDADPVVTELTLRFYKTSELIFFSEEIPSIDWKTLRQELKTLLGLWTRIEGRRRS